VTDTGPLAQLRAVEAFTAWLAVDKEHYPQEDRRLDLSYERAPVLRSHIEALLAAAREMALIANERIGQLSEAQELARALYRLFDSFPFCIDDLDERMSLERLPQWIGGEADTWQREDGS